MPSFLAHQLPYVVMGATFTYLLLVSVEYFLLKIRLRRYCRTEIFPKPTSYDKVKDNGDKDVTI